MPISRTAMTASIILGFRRWLWLNGEDLRDLPPIERKKCLRKIVRRSNSSLLYVDYLETHGRGLFEKVCALDLEGIVAKRKDSTYQATEKPSPHRVKIKNSNYSQAGGRTEFFE